MMSHTRTHKHTPAPQKVENGRQYRQAKVRAQRQLDAELRERYAGRDAVPVRGDEARYRP
jgi:hypothetical protein